MSTRNGFGFSGSPNNLWAVSVEGIGEIWLHLGQAGIGEGDAAPQDGHERDRKELAYLTECERRSGLKMLVRMTPRSRGSMLKVLVNSGE